MRDKGLVEINIQTVGSEFTYKQGSGRNLHMRVLEPSSLNTVSRLGRQYYILLNCTIQYMNPRILYNKRKHLHIYSNLDLMNPHKFNITRFIAIARHVKYIYSSVKPRKYGTRVSSKLTYTRGSSRYLHITKGVTEIYI